MKQSQPLASDVPRLLGRDSFSVEGNQFMDVRPSVPSESCGHWLDGFPSPRQFHLSTQYHPLSLSCSKLVPHYCVGDLCFSPLWWDASFYFCWIRRKRESSFTLLERKLAASRLLPSLNLCSIGHKLGQDGIKLLWETLCNVPFRGKQTPCFSWFQKNIASSLLSNIRKMLVNCSCLTTHC